MNIFEKLTEVEADTVPDVQADEPLYCQHKTTGPRNVLVCFESGSITGISCPDCKLSLPLVAYDEIECVGGEDVPMVLTTTVEEYFHPLDMIRPEYDTFHTLTARAGQEAS